MKVSILIPVYNSEKYISRCLDSVINQTFRNLEIIIYNDGSNDNTLNIVNEYMKKDNRIKVYTDKNKGLAYARNKLINYCSGDFFYFIDVDDWIEKDTIEDMISHLTTNVDIVISKTMLTKEANNGFKHKPYMLLKRFKYNDKKYFLDFNSPYAWNMLVNRNFIQKDKLYFNDMYRYFEDAGITSYWIFKARNIFLLDKFKYYYFVNQTSLSRNSITYRKMIQGTRQIEYLVEKLNKEKDIPDYLRRCVAFYMGIIFFQTKFQSRMSKNEKKTIFYLLGYIQNNIFNIKCPKVWYKKYLYFIYKLFIK